MSATAPVLKLDRFGVAFGDKVVLRDVGFSTAGSECTVILGPSGTGKSTLLRTLAGYNESSPALRTWGEVLYQGSPCAASHRPALVMQHSKLLVSNVFENLVCELPGRESLTQRKQLEHVEEVLESFGQTHLQALLNDKVVEQPVVDQRAIAILRNLIARPALLMLDEPTTGLSDDEAGKLLSLIKRLALYTPVLVVMHHLSQTREIADAIVLMANGVVEAHQPCEEFFQNPSGECAKIFLVTGSCPEHTRDEEPHKVEWELPPAVLVPAARTSPGAVSAACGPRGFLWLQPGQLAGTPWPGIVHGARYDLEALREVGVTRLVSLTETPFDPAQAADFGIVCRSCPMPDMHPPTIDQAIALCLDIDADLAAGEVVAVHCRAGLGRTGTVLAAYWMWKSQGAAGSVQALEHVRRIEPGWVQSVSQVKFLEAFEIVVRGRIPAQAGVPALEARAVS